MLGQKFNLPKTYSDRCQPEWIPNNQQLFFRYLLLLVMFLHMVSTQPLFGFEESIQAEPTATTADGSGLLANWAVLPDAVAVEPVYFGEMFANTRRGLSNRRSPRYQGLLNVGLAIDLDRLETRLPGRFFMLGQTTHGKGLTETIVGDSLVLSDIDSFRNTTQMGEYWWEIPLFSEKVKLRVGKQDVNSDFIYIDTAEYFIQSSFELTPNSTLPTFPQQSFAAVTMIELDPSTTLKFGLWDALAQPGSWGFSGNDTIFLISELEYRYSFADGKLPGTLAIAAAFQSKAVVDGQTLDPAHGYAVQIEQMLVREWNEDSQIEQGLSVFVAYYPRFFGPRKLQESIGDSAVAGAVYKGMLPGRSSDVVGVGVSWAELFQGGSNQETVFECFYRVQLNSRIFLQPDLQYIATPSGLNPDAFLVGLRVETHF